MWSRFYIPGDVFSELGGVGGVEFDSKRKVPKRVCGEIKHTFNQTVHKRERCRTLHKSAQVLFPRLLNISTVWSQFGNETHCAAASLSPWRGPASSKRQKAEITLGGLETWLMHSSMSHFALIAMSVPNDSFSIWFHRESQLVPAEPFARSESRFNSTICFFIVLQIYWQPVTYISDLITSQWCRLL